MPRKINQYQNRYYSSNTGQTVTKMLVFQNLFRKIVFKWVNKFAVGMRPELGTSHQKLFGDCAWK